MKKITDEQWTKIFFAFLPVALIVSITCQAPHVFLFTLVYCCVWYIRQLEKKRAENGSVSNVITLKIRITTAVMILACIGLAANLFFLWKS